MPEATQEQDWQDVADSRSSPWKKPEAPPQFGSIAVDAIRVLQQMLEAALEDEEST